MSNRFTFEEELDKAMGEVEVPLLGEVAGLEPCPEPPALVAARKAFFVAQEAFEHAKIRERRTGRRMPKVVEDTYMQTYNTFDKMVGQHSFAMQAGDCCSIHNHRPNRFCKSFHGHP